MNQLTEEQPQRREGGVGKSAFVHLILVLFGDKQDLRDMGESLSTKTLLSRPPPPKKVRSQQLPQFKRHQKKTRQQCHTMPFLLTHCWVNVHTFYTVTFTLEHQSRALHCCSCAATDGVGRWLMRHRLHQQFHIQRCKFIETLKLGQQSVWK